jgi:osmotically-inducible protein OsmY
MQADARGVTAEDQSNADADVAVVRSIRQSIVDSESMSINARNVKVIAEGGVVTLRGPVDGELEKQAIVNIAMRTPGVTRVDDQLELAQ